MMICGVVVVLGLLSLGQAELVTIDMMCDPQESHRFDVCPDGYCCVRDEYLPKEVYCKRLGTLNEACTTRATETNCPCMEGMVCHPNIFSATGTASLYGKCAAVTTTTPPPTTTTTTMSSSNTVPDAVSDATTTHAPFVVSTSHPHCPHGHSCEHEHHHNTHSPHGHHTADPIVG